jgi:hypothetical protein
MCSLFPWQHGISYLFLFSNVNIGELFPQKNQELEIFNFTKVMAKNVEIFGSFFRKLALV